MDNDHRNCNKFSRITMKLIKLSKKITDSGHHNSNKFSRVTMKSIYLFFKK